MKTLIVPLMVMVSAPLWSQFYEDFDTKDLNHWTGDITQFIVNTDAELQLQADQVEEASIFRKVDSMPEPVFSGSLFLDFAPSNANRLKLVLAQYNEPDSIQYALEIGDKGSPDTLYFAYYSKSFQFRYPLKTVYQEQVAFNYEIQIDQDEWTVSITPENEKTEVDVITPPPLPDLPFVFGIHCEFTSSRRDKFYFDDIGVGQRYLDSLPPSLEEISIIDSTTIQFYWNEAINIDSSSEIDIFPFIEIASYEKLTDSSTLLILKDAMRSGATYQAQIHSKDSFENKVSVDTLWTYYDTPLAGPGQLLITEIMADPSPAYALPECEYIEIYNPTDHYFRLSDYTISDDRRQAFLFDTLIAPRSYFFFVDSKNKGLYQDWPNVLAVEGLPTINNDVDIVRIQDYVGRSIHEVVYDRKFFDDPDRSNGGWSLEMKDTRQPCLYDKNWTAADLIKCGSPGKGNSQSIKLNLQDLKIKNATVIHPQHILLHFNQSVYSEDDLKFELRPDLGSSQYTLDATLGTLDIYFENNMEPGTDYRLTIQEVSTCTQEMLDSLPEIHFFLPSVPGSGQLQINEVLFNPYSGGVDFVEIMNTSTSHLSLRNVCLGLLSPADTTYTCIPVPHSIPPYGVLAWTVDSATLKQHYPRAHNLIEEDLVSIPDEGGHLQLWLVKGRDSLILDRTHFSDQDHSPVVFGQEGISLQKVYASWISTTPSIGATPGWNPSFPSVDQEQSPAFLSAAYEQYSPNGDGFKDYLPITISPSKPGYNVRVDIYDWNGQHVFSLLKDGLINRETTVVWKGQTDQGLPAVPGAYIVMGFFAHPDGDIFREKVTCIVN